MMPIHSVRMIPVLPRSVEEPMSNLPALLVALLLMGWPAALHSEVITRLPTSEKVVAFTFDACETRTPSFFDPVILDFLKRQRVPATFFVSGRFASRNREVLEDLRRWEIFEVENHSLSHVQHMERLSEEAFRREVLESEAILWEMTGIKPVFFRFPAGNYNAAALRAVESMGYRVVHWTFPSGDPDRRIGVERLSRWVLDRTRPGSILIFHVNGRGYHTGEALPRIVEGLRGRGYRFVTLREALGSE